MEKTVILLQLSATLFMTGVIWLTQLVVYPQLAYLSGENFARCHDAYRFWITPVVAPPMLIELATAILLLFYTPENIDSKFIWAGLMLVAVIWASTFFLQVPLHEKLARGFDPRAHELLVKTNWIRTFAWTLRAALVLYFAWLLIRS